MPSTVSVISKAMAVASSFFLVALSSAEPISLKGADGFDLKGDYFQGKAGRPAVLMLHQCNAERSMYRQLGEALSAKGIHALSLDFRLYGQSVTEEVSLAAIREKAANREEGRRLSAPHRSMWPEDVLSAYEFIREMAGDGAPIGAIGASCGGFQAVILAEARGIDAMAFFSSGINEDATTRYLTLEPIPTLVIAAQEDRRTYERAQAIFEASKHPHNRIVAYKGNGHGHPLFEHDPNLLSTLVDWFDRQLTNASS